jgi:hypothetical protein
MASAPTATLQAFGRFWDAYPVRPENPKAAAREVFCRRVREGADPEEIVAAAGRYAAYVKQAGKESHFIPHARTWLSQRRWEDFSAPAPAAPAEAAPSAHPLAWMIPLICEDPWKSWIEPLRVEDGEPVRIIARTAFAADRVRSRWASLIAERLGDIVITVKE